MVTQSLGIRGGPGGFKQRSRDGIPGKNRSSFAAFGIEGKTAREGSERVFFSKKPVSVKRRGVRPEKRSEPPVH